MVSKFDIHPIVRRPAERLAICRGCDKDISKGEDMVYTYSFRGNGGGIPICLDCARLIGKLVQED